MVAYGKYESKNSDDSYAKAADGQGTSGSNDGNPGENTNDPGSPKRSSGEPLIPNAASATAINSSSIA